MRTGNVSKRLTSGIWLLAWVMLAAGCATTSPSRVARSPAPPLPRGSDGGSAAGATNAGSTATPGQPAVENGTGKPESGPKLANAEVNPSEHLGGASAAQPRGGKAADTISSRATALLQKMSLEEKVGQLFMLELREGRTGKLFREATPAALSIIESYHPGGIILFGGNIDTIDQTVELIKDIQKASRTPLFVAVDEEGGNVSRLTSSGRMHAVHMPAAAVVGSTGDPSLAYDEGRFVGRELRSLGINMDLAPVADVDTNPRNTVIGRRAYSSDPHTAAQMASAMVRGLQSVDVSSVIKHFPGHGDTSTDSHLGPAVVRNDLSRLKSVEFLPFEAGIAAGADGVLVGHLLLPEILSEKNIPATFSPYVLGELLRGELGFRKLIITDALNMGAITDFWRSSTAALDAFQAGADILLMPEDPRAAFNAILAAVRSDEIPESRLNESVHRILMVKLERNIIGTPIPAPDPHQVLGSAEGKRLLSDIEKRAAVRSVGPSR